MLVTLLHLCGNTLAIMFLLMKGLPGFAIGVTMRGRVTSADFETVLQPAVKRVADEWKGVNLLIVQDTAFKNFTATAWMTDIALNIAYFMKWNRIGMVTKEKLVENTFGIFDFVMPGQVKMFNFGQLDEAKTWISEAGDLL